MGKFCTRDTAQILRNIAGTLNQIGDHHMAKAPLHIFVDTNVWLAFYSYTNDDVEQLRIITKLIGTGDIKLYLTQQVVDEFFRNREKKLDEAIRTFAKAEVPKNLPRCMSDYEQAKEFRKALEAFMGAKASLVDRARNEAAQKELGADKIFQEITAASPPIEATDKLYLAALRRRNLGNPPGKSNSLGDQLNWEFLLDNVPDGADLHVISNDGDFESNLIPGKADQFLIDEWARVKSGTLALHSELRPFLKANFPTIELAVDIEKNEYIASLVASGSFASTHLAVSRLTPLKDQLTWENADALVDAALNNSQVGWIATDADVKELYEFLVFKFGDKLDAERASKLAELLNPTPWSPPESDTGDDIPF